MKEWIEKRIQEMKSDNVISLDNWREFNNNREKGRQKENAGTQALDHSGRGEPPNHKWEGN